MFEWPFSVLAFYVAFALKERSLCLMTQQPTKLRLNNNFSGRMNVSIVMVVPLLCGLICLGLSVRLSEQT